MSKLLMIGTDRKIFEEGSAVRARQIEYAKKHDEVHIIVFTLDKDSDRYGEQALSSNCWVYPTRSRFKLRYPFDAINLGRFIVKGRGITDIVTQDASLTAMAGVALKKEFNISLEIQIHEDIGSPYYPRALTNKIRKTFALKYIPRADSIRVVSDKIKDYLIAGLKIDEAKISVRPIFVDTERIKNAPITIDLHKKYPQFDKIALMASRLEPEKNIGLAIKAWPEVLKSVPQAGLIIVGEGSQGTSLRSNVFAADPIVFEPWTDPATLASYYKTCDAFLVTSFFEGYGMTLVEAQAAACRIVSTDVGVAKEAGAIIAPYGPAGFAAAVIKALSADSEASR